MILEFKATEEPIRYSFYVDKEFKNRNKILYSVHSDGILNITANPYEKIEHAIEYIFRVETYNLKGVKEPAIFNPTKWIFDRQQNNTFVRSKDNLRQIWNRYKDKHRKNSNLASMLIAERFFFDTPTGFEYSGFSNGPYLPFFINYFDIDLKEDTIIQGLKWIHVPLDLPLMMTLRCATLDKKSIQFEGWVSLDENELDFFLTKRAFKERAKSYHFSKDFTIESNIKIKVNTETGYMESTSFSLNFNTNDGEFTEAMNYNIRRHTKPQEISLSSIRIIDPH